MKKRCQFQASDGRHCQEQATDSGFCFWHDPLISKDGMHLTKELEAYARGGGVTQGLRLSRADLHDVNLVNSGSQIGYDFSGSDLYRANLKGAHMFNLNLCEGSLMKANLSEANLHCAKLIDCNLLGIRCHNTRIENIEIGDVILQERQGRQSEREGDMEQAIDYYEQAEEIYRDMRKASEQEGIFSLSGYFIQRELTVRRFQFPFYSVKRLVSKAVDLFCGYGELPHRVVMVSIATIILCAFLYLFTGLSFDGTVRRFEWEQGWSNVELFADCLYYSVVTFTTLGYGDFTPIGLSRLIAAMEAFAGSFTMALFVVVFVKKMTR